MSKEKSVSWHPDLGVACDVVEPWPVYSVPWFYKKIVRTRLDDITKLSDEQLATFSQLMSVDDAWRQQPGDTARWLQRVCLSNSFIRLECERRNKVAAAAAASSSCVSSKN
jgi:hypothetical protein